MSVSRVALLCRSSNFTRIFVTLVGRSSIATLRNQTIFTAVNAERIVLSHLRPPSVLGNPFCTSSVGKFLGNEPQIVVSHEELVEKLHQKQICLIDVREEKELRKFGKICGSVHIPLGEIESALDLSDEDFHTKYGFQKPRKGDKNVAFHCMGGMRSLKAVNKAYAKGFHNVRHYPPGFNGWSEKEPVQK